MVNHSGQSSQGGALPAQTPGTESGCHLPPRGRRLLAVGRELANGVAAEAGAWQKAGMATVCVQSGIDALSEILLNEFSAILVSADLPDMRPSAFLEEAVQLAPFTLFATTARELPSSAAAIRMHPLAPHSTGSALSRQMLDLIETHPLEVAPPPAEDSLSTVIHSINRAGHITEETRSTLDAMVRLCGELRVLTGCDALAIHLIQQPQPCFVAVSQRQIQNIHERKLTDEIHRTFIRLTGTPPPSTPMDKVCQPPTASASALPSIARSVCVPVIVDDQIKGVLCAAYTDEISPDVCTAPLLFHLANHAVQVHQDLWRARHMAARDPMTGLYNKGMFNEILQRTFSLAQRKGDGIGLLLFDFDHLKSINDHHGHLAGDCVLRDAAGLTLATMRTTDVVARFGGDEFAVILPGTDLAEARRVAERLLAAFHERSFSAVGACLRVTVSIGVAAMRPSRAETCQALLAAADEALLAAKRGGRDRVCDTSTGNTSGSIPARAAQGPADAAMAKTLAAATRKRVLVLDDEPAVREILGKMLQMLQFETIACSTLQEAVQAIESTVDDFDIVLTDLHLDNNTTGIDLLRELQEKAPWTVKMVVSGYASKETAIECLRHGAFDFIEKPFAYTHLSTAMNRAMEHRRLLVANRRYHLHLEELVRSRSESLTRTLDTLRRSYSQTIQTLALLIDAREANTGLHSRAVRDAVRLLAHRMDVSHHDLEVIEMGAVLHDIGKVAIPDAILLKSGVLTPEERKIMQTHPRVGHDLLAGVPFLHDAAQIVLQHHEAFDGSGYPAGLRGEQICMGARIFAVLDAYHAMRSMRCYRPALSEEEACNEINRCSGMQFDPAVVAAFHTCRPQIESVFAAVRGAA